MNNTELSIAETTRIMQQCKFRKIYVASRLTSKPVLGSNESGGFGSSLLKVHGPLAMRTSLPDRKKVIRGLARDSSPAIPTTTVRKFYLLLMMNT